jgi:pimeloyl-ACP methyl ester carboxylesterase
MQEIRETNALWITVNPSFCRLERQLLTYLSRDRTVAHWGYTQTADEPCSLDVAVTLLHDYLKSSDRPLHLIGHSTGGLVGLLYARQHPKRVKSLTLLSVGVNPAVDWKAHYYTQLKRLPCSRTRILAQIALSLFGQQRPDHLLGLIKILDRDLMTSLSLHSLFRNTSLPPGGVPMPLMIGGGQSDIVVDSMQLQRWQGWMKPSDRLWLCPNGRHFFYATHAQVTAQEILNFWNPIDTVTKKSLCLQSS